MQLSMQSTAAAARAAVPAGGARRTRQPRSLQVRAAVETEGKKEITPVRFIVRKDKLTDWGLAAMGVLPRGTMGLACVGYNFKIEKDEDPAAYAVIKAGGWKFSEYCEALLYKRPEKPLEIFEFQGCPFCKKVREVIDYYNIDAVFYPCPKDGPTWRPMAIEEGGKKQFPYMRDPNTGKKMYESDDIIRYIADTYGDGQVPGGLSPSPLTAALCGVALMPRMGKGSAYTPSKATKDTQPIDFYAYEGSPFCKARSEPSRGGRRMQIFLHSERALPQIVREVLCELEIPHKHISMARGSARRQEFQEKYGLFQVPYIEDPNTGAKMFESAEIIDYLRATYAA